MRDNQLRLVIHHTVGKHVKSRGTARDERSPPPPVVFGAKLKVTHHDCDFGARDDENDKNESEETKDVIELLEPYARENEEELNENGAKRKNTTDKNGCNVAHVPRLRGDLPGNLVGAHRLFERLALETHVATYESQRHGNTEPEEHEHKEGSKFFFKSEIDSKRNFALNFSVFLNPKLVSLKSFGSILIKPIVLSDSLIDFEREILSNTLRLFLNQTKLVTFFLDMIYYNI